MLRITGSVNKTNCLGEPPSSQRHWGGVLATGGQGEWGGRLGPDWETPETCGKGTSNAAGGLREGHVLFSTAVSSTVSRWEIQVLLQNHVIVPLGSQQLGPFRVTWPFSRSSTLQISR